MNLLPLEQIAAAQNAHLEILFGLTNKAFDGLQKLLELNLQVIQSALAETQQNTQKVLAVKDPQELLALQASLMQPAAEKLLSYSRRLFDIASAAQAEFKKVTEAQYEAQSRRVQTLVDNLAKNAPTGSEAVAAAWKSALGATNASNETIRKATVGAVEVSESNFNVAATAASEATQRAIEQASRATKK